MYAKRGQNGPYLYFSPGLGNWRVGANYRRDAAFAASSGNTNRRCPDSGSRHPWRYSRSPLPQSGVRLRVVQGTDFCQVINGGTCVTDGSGNHGNNEACTIQAMVAGTISSVGNFDVESHRSCAYDYILIGTRRFCGSGRAAPTNVGVSSLETVRWRSDSSVTRAGWTLCLTPTGEFYLGVQVHIISLVSTCILVLATRGRHVRQFVRAVKSGKSA